MLFWTLQITIISIILIFLVHHLIVFFKSNLTVPKVKDLVNAPAQKYDDIFRTISSNAASLNTNYSKDYMDTLLPKQNNNSNPEAKFVPNVASMKDELKNFLKTKIKTDSETSGTTNIANLDSFNGSSNFSYSPL